MRDLNKTLGAVTITGYWYYPDLVCLPNDRFGAIAYYVFGAVSRELYWMYQNAHNGAWTKVIIETKPGTDSWTYPKVMISQGSTQVYIIGYHSTGDDVLEWNAAYNAVAGTWQASETIIAETHTGWGLGASNSVWPKTSGISWCQPKTGQAVHFRTEDGSPDLMQIWTQSVTWTPDLTTDWPEITTAGLDQGTYGVLYSFGMSKSGGTAPFEWTIVSGPIWLSIGLATGILSGTPTGVGTFVVEIQLADVIPRTDTESFNLKINSAVTEGGSEPTEGFSAEDLELASLWLILAIAAIGVGLAREFKRFTYGKQ
jgi:hypothetical protein